MKSVLSCRVDQTLIDSFYAHYVSKGIVVGSKSQLLTLALHDLADRLTEEGFIYKKQPSKPSYQIMDVLESRRVEHISAKREIATMFNKLKGEDKPYEDDVEENLNSDECEWDECKYGEDEDENDV